MDNKIEKKIKIDNKKRRIKVLMKNKFHIRKNLIQKKKINPSIYYIKKWK